jgi:hypothetical protein
MPIARWKSLSENAKKILDAMGDKAAVETAICGFDFVAFHACTEQIFDLRLILRHLGVPICDQSCVFGDKENWLSTVQ